MCFAFDFSDFRFLNCLNNRQREERAKKREEEESQLQQELKRKQEEDMKKKEEEIRRKLEEDLQKQREQEELPKPVLKSPKKEREQLKNSPGGSSNLAPPMLSTTSRKVSWVRPPNYFYSLLMPNFFFAGFIARVAIRNSFKSIINR